MAWARPFGHYASGIPLDVDQINETLARYTWELAFVNESNWDYGSASTPLLESVAEDDQLADDAMMTLYHKEQGINPYATGGSAVQLTQLTTWDAIVEMDTIRTRGGMFLIIASFQISNWDTSVFEPGHFFAVGINNAPRVESIIGSGDEGNDPSFESPIRVPRGAATPDNPGARANTIGPGVRSSQIGLSTQWAGYLPPGEYIISLMSRSAEAPLFDKTHYLTCYELIVLETHGGP